MDIHDFELMVLARLDSMGKDLARINNHLATLNGRVGHLEADVHEIDGEVAMNTAARIETEAMRKMIRLIAAGVAGALGLLIAILGVILNATL